MLQHRLEMPLLRVVADRVGEVVEIHIMTTTTPPTTDLHVAAEETTAHRPLPHLRAQALTGGAIENVRH